MPHAAPDATRETLRGLHTSAVFAGTACLLVRVAFDWRPAGIVGGVLYAIGASLFLVSRLPRLAPVGVDGRRRPVAVGAALVYGGSMLVLAALLLWGSAASRGRGADQRAKAASGGSPRLTARATSFTFPPPEPQTRVSGPPLGQHPGFGPAEDAMAKSDITGKRKLLAQNVSHSNIKTKRWQNVNIQTRRVWVPELGRFVSLKLTTRDIRTIDKIGVVAYAKRHGVKL